jgi:hypothetical protein
METLGLRRICANVEKSRTGHSRYDGLKSRENSDPLRLGDA